MPNGEGYRSKSQMRMMFAKEARGEVKKGTARRWAHETKNIRRLPERVRLRGSRHMRSYRVSPHRRKESRG